MIFSSISLATWFSIGNTFRAIVLGPLLIFAIAEQFNPELQGYFYTFNSLLALQVCIEGAFSVVLVQFASHEFSGLKWANLRLTGDPANLSRLSQILRFALKWYLAASCVLIVLLGVGGYLFLKSSSSMQVSWVLPWLTLCLLSGMKLVLLPIFAIYEGAGRVDAVYAYRFLDGLLLGLVLIVAIMMGYGLWSLVVALLISLLFSLSFLHFRFGKSLRELLRRTRDCSFRWEKEMLPMQWRLGLSAIANYLAFQIFTPVLFRFQGPVEAGRMGMTWNIVTAMSGLSTAFVTTKVPMFGQLIARRQFRELDRIAFVSCCWAVGVTAIASGLVLGGLWFASIWFPAYASRVLPLPATASFLAATVLMQIGFTQASYLRAHRQEPFFGLSLLTGVLIAGSAFVLGKYWGAEAIAWGYFAVVALVVLPLGSWIFVRKRREWHGSPDGENEF